MYYAMIKEHPTKDVYRLYTDDYGVVITNTSFNTLYKEVVAKYGQSDVIVMKQVKYIKPPVERLDI